MDVCYRLHDQEEVTGTSPRQLKAASKPQALALVGEFNYHDIY